MGIWTEPPPTITLSNVKIMDQAAWSFSDNKPRWGPRLSAGAPFDPFPAYAHELWRVELARQDVERLCPPIWDVELYVVDREEEGRSNGYSNLREPSHYDGNTWVKDRPIGTIVLSGKRVPPHPALTRYLVAHEYGHNIEWMLEHLHGGKHVHVGEVVAEYAKLRGLDEAAQHHGSGGRWHDSVHEIFACDFRIIVCDIESDYWPHPDIPRPEHVEADLPSWWSDAVARLAAARKDGVTPAE